MSIAENKKIPMPGFFRGGIDYFHILMYILLREGLEWARSGYSR
jgi:hypothetical protein